jgi:hypothetical protein
MKYLHVIKVYREVGRPEVPSDETYAHAHIYTHSSHTTHTEWDGESGAKMKAPTSSMLVTYELTDIKLTQSPLFKSVLFQVESEVSYQMPF